jgi:hypothetical protein
MKKIIRIILGIVAVVAAFFIFRSTYNEYNINIKDDTLDYELKYKGLKNSRDFVVDARNNYYIAYKDRIQLINGNGSSFDLFRDKSLNINSLEYKEDKLYYSSGNKVYYYDLKKKEHKLLVDNLPNLGDYKESKIRIKDDELFISIGAATNSGIVGSDNKWLSVNPYHHDISPKDVTVRGLNFGSEKTGAFVPYKTKNTAGQIIPGHMPGNASIVQYNITTGYLETFAWGIRNVNSMSFNSEGRLIASVGGMEERGLRPISGDVDYIYEIKGGLWYGWPEYSGGDPVTSPRFRGENNKKASFILENHPTTNPPAPIYQHKHLNALKGIEIDTKGVLGDKDCIYFYDDRDNIIYALKKSGSSNEKVLLNKGMKIANLKIYKDSLIVLDNENGVIYSIHKQIKNPKKSIDKSSLYYLMLLTISIAAVLVWKFNYDTKKK